MAWRLVENVTVEEQVIPSGFRATGRDSRRSRDIPAPQESPQQEWFLPSTPFRDDEDDDDEAGTAECFLRPVDVELDFSGFWAASHLKPGSHAWPSNLHVEVRPRTAEA